MRRLLSRFAISLFAATAVVTFAPPASAGPLDPFCYEVRHPWSGTWATVCTPWNQMAFADSESVAARLVPPLIEIAERRGGIEEATMVAAGLPARSFEVLQVARRRVDEAGLAEDVRAEVHRLIDLLSGTGLFRR